MADPKGFLEVHRVAMPEREPLREDDFRYLHDTHGLPRDLVVGILQGE